MRVSKKFYYVVISPEKLYCICRKNSRENICEWVKKFYCVAMLPEKFYCECREILRKDIREWVKIFIALWCWLKNFIVNAEKICVIIFVSEWKILLYLILLKNFYCEYWRNLRENIYECVKNFVVSWYRLKNFIVFAEKIRVKIFMSEWKNFVMSRCWLKNFIVSAEKFCVKIFMSAWKNFVVLWYRLKKFIVNAEKVRVKICVSE